MTTQNVRDSIKARKIKNSEVGRVRITCECSRIVSIDEPGKRVSCKCGRSYKSDVWVVVFDLPKPSLQEQKKAS